MKRITILALESCMQSSVTGFFDILSVASRLASSGIGGLPAAPVFEPCIATPDDKPVTCFNGLTLTPEAALDSGPDILFIPVIYGNLEATLEDPDLIRHLARLHRNGCIMTAVCAGAFVLAETGILDGREATTHWDLARDFVARFPAVRLKKEKMLVDEGDVITAGGVTAYMDLALYLVGRFGALELAAAVSKALLIDPVRPTQSPYSAARPDRSHGDPEILALQDWLDTRAGEPLTVQDLSERAGLGVRTLARRFKKATGDTPVEYIQRLRLTRARTLLETTTLPVDRITWESGYEDVSSFRRLFKQRTGLAPVAYRKRFSLCRTRFP